MKQVSISDLKVAGKNEMLYHPIRDDDPAILELAESIENNGILSPLIITKDGFVIDGHRRRAACLLAGVQSVPCRVRRITSDDPKYLTLLRECNRQRVKGFDEIIRESVLDATADQKEIAKNLKMERLKRSHIEVDPMEIVGSKSRAAIKGNRPLLDAGITIIYELKDFWPLSDRHIHYRLLNNPPLKHISKPDSIYQNDRRSYHTLCGVLTRGRLTGEIPWESIGDDTRPVSCWNVFPNIEPFVQNQFDGFMTGYFRDYLQSQPNHIEIIGEKLTVESIIRPVAMKFCVPYTIGRGYSSIVPRYEMAKRFWKSGKETLLVLILSDHDPDGEEIAQSFARSMRDDFGVEIHPVRVALTKEQVDSLDLPPGGQAKKTSPNYKKFKDLYGDVSYELEAVDPERLQEILREAIESVIEVDAFNHEAEEEEKEMLTLAKYRKQVLNNMKPENS